MCFSPGRGRSSLTSHFLSQAAWGQPRSAVRASKARQFLFRFGNRSADIVKLRSCAPPDSRGGCPHAVSGGVLVMLADGQHVPIWIFEPRHLIAAGRRPDSQFLILNEGAGESWVAAHLQIRGGSRNLSGQTNKSTSGCQCCTAPGLRLDGGEVE